MSNRNGFFRVVLYLGAYFCAFAILERPSDPDAATTLRPFFGSVVYFLSFVIALFSWGEIARKIIKVDFGDLWVSRLALGSITLSLFGALFGAFGWIGFEHGFLLQCFLFLGVLFAGNEVVSGSKVAAPIQGRINRILSFAVFAFFFAHFLRRALLASLLHGGTDPLFYHLLAPRYWVELGKISFSHLHPMTIHASFWEYLFIWPNAILGAPGGRGLIESQYFNQWLHLFSVVGVYFSARRYFQPLISNQLLIDSGLAMALTNPHFFAYSITAKNDFGIIFWTVCLGLLLRKLKPRDRPGHFVAGVLIAITFFGKTVSIFALLMIVAFAVVEWEEKFSAFRNRVPMLMVGALCVSLPEAFRNFVATGNPLPGVVPIAMKAKWASMPLHLFMAGTAPKMASFKYFLGQTIELFSQVPVQWASFFSIGIFLIGRKTCNLKEKRLIQLTLFCVSVCLLYSMGNYKVRFYRWLGAALVFLPICSLGVLEVMLRKLSDRARLDIKKTMTAVLVICGLGLSFYRDFAKVTLFQTAHEVYESIPTRELRNARVFEGGDSLAWLRMNVEPGVLIGTTSHLMLYYVSHLRVASIPYHPVLDPTLSQAVFIEDLARRAQAIGIRYVLDVDERNKPPKPYARLFQYLIDQHPTAISYEGLDSRIIDVNRLVGELFQSCQKVSEKDVMTGLGVLGWMDSEFFKTPSSLTN